MSTRFEAFGQLTVRSDRGAPLVLCRRRERDLLALLIAAQGHPLSAERLVHELWGQDAPATGTARVQVAVSRLRSLLDPRRTDPSAVRTSLAGYELGADRDAVDVWAFERAADEALAATSPIVRLALTERALGLWAEEPYADCAAPLVRAEAARLEELHLGLEGARAEAMIVVGRPDVAVRVLARVVPAQPYREDLWALLARAQYASDRQADALASLATLRARLADDLGVDPSPRTRTLEEQILRQDAALVTAARPPGHPATRHARRQRVRVGRCTASSVTPRSRVAV